MRTVRAEDCAWNELRVGDAIRGAEEKGGGDEVIDVMIKILPGGIMPAYMSAGAAGMDCFAREGGKIWSPQTRFSGDGADIRRAKIALGFALSLPEGYEAQIRPRSGLGAKNGIHCALGTVDSDYRGEVSALLFNLGTEDFEWKAGDRVCQLVISPVVRAQLHQVPELEVTQRGDKGFGSSGINAHEWRCAHGNVDCGICK